MAQRQCFQMRWQPKTYDSSYPTVSVFSFLGPKAFALQLSDHQFFETPWKFSDSITLFLPSDSFSGPAHAHSVSSFCQSHLLVFCYNWVFGNVILNGCLCLDEFQIVPSPSTNLLLPSYIFPPVVLLSLSLVKISYLSPIFSLPL